MMERLELHEAAILIVDDEESLRVTFELFLRREGYRRVVTAATFQEALEALERERFDLIISDIVLEGAVGTELLRKIREQGVKCPVVLVTGFPNLETAAEAVRYGAFDYVSKPVNKETLLRLTRQAIGQWGLEQEKRRLEQENYRMGRYLEIVFSSVKDAIITVDHRLRVVQANHAAQDCIPEPRELSGKLLSELAGDLPAAILKDAKRALSSKVAVAEHQVECRDRQGEPQTISLIAAPLFAPEDEEEGAVIVARKIDLGLLGTPKHRSRFHGFVGSSKAMQEVYRLIDNVGKVDTAVLVTGESGTGKELAAEALHAVSKRQQRPLIKMDCAAVPEDLLESELFGHRKGAFTGADKDRPGRLLLADNGTLFLDEIGDISQRMQLRLLRFLQERTFNPVGSDVPVKVDVRVIAATNVDLRQKVAEGKFRQDLYYRLKVVEIFLPPLRDRQECLPLLIGHFLDEISRKMERRVPKISDQALALLLQYPWPGNVRELQHVMERAVVICNGGVSLLREHLPDEITNLDRKMMIALGGEPSKKGAVEHLIPLTSRQEGARLVPEQFISEEERILGALRATGGNKAKAAKILGIDRSTLYRKLRRYQLQI